MKHQTTGHWAVITGASSGAGFELAKQFAMNGYDLLVVADDPGVVEAAQVFARYGVNVDSLQVDLSEHGGVEKLYRRIQEEPRNLDAIVMNTRLGMSGVPFDRTDLDMDLSLMSLNIMSIVHLTKYILKDMKKAGHGKILFSSSSSDLMNSPYETIYMASNAFVRAFAESLTLEIKDHDIKIACLQKDSKKLTLAEIARIGFDAIKDDKLDIIPGMKIKKPIHYVNI